MSWTFNPPPGWPRQPAGWVPPPGWAPDPSWPPAPAGWQFWVPTPAPPLIAPTLHEAPTTVVSQPVSPPVTGPASPAYQTGSAPGPAAPAAAPAARRPWHRGWWAVGAALAVLLVGCLVGTAVALLTQPAEPAAAPSGLTAAPTPQAGAAGQAGADGLAPGQRRTGESPATVGLDLPAGDAFGLAIQADGDWTLQPG